MNRLRRLLLASSLGVLFALLGHVAHGRDGEQCTVVRLGTVGWLDAGSSSALSSVLLQGLGYQPLTRRLPVPTLFASLKNGDLDAFLEVMVPTMGESLRPYMVDNSIKLLQRNLSGTKYTLAVNSRGRDLGIDHFDKLAAHGEALNFEIHGIEPGSDGNLLIDGMISQGLFGLDDFRLVESSEEQMIQQVAEATRDGRPIVFLGWEPHPMNIRFELRFLSGGDKIFGPAFGGADVYTGVRASLDGDCPNLHRLLGNLQFSLPMVNEVMTAILELDAPPLIAAAAWLRQNPLTLDAWLDGVTSIDGEEGLATVKQFIGLSP
jgi:glycine betaine/proline transport system substrate-binding protein